MATNADNSDLKKQFRAMVQGSQSLTVAYIGVVNDLFAALKRLGTGDVAAIATATRMDAGYVRRWADAAFAFGYLDAEGEIFRLSEMGAAMSPDAPDTLMPLSMTMVSSVHMALRSASLMRSGERPGETVMAEVETLLPWFGAMLEGAFARFFEEKICPDVPIFAEINERGGLVVDLGCGNGWYLRALARRCGSLRGLGDDAFDENVAQATRVGQSGRRERVQARSACRSHCHEPRLASCLGGRRRPVHPAVARQSSSGRGRGDLGTRLAVRSLDFKKACIARTGLPKPQRACSRQSPASRRRDCGGLRRGRACFRNLPVRRRHRGHYRCAARLARSRCRRRGNGRATCTIVKKFFT